LLPPVYPAIIGWSLTVDKKLSRAFLKVTTEQLLRLRTAGGNTLKSLGPLTAKEFS